MLSRRLTQLIAANQIAGAVWVVVAALAFGVHSSSSELVLAVIIALATLVGGVLALRNSRRGIAALTAVLVLQVIRFADASFAWQFYLGATWRVTLRPVFGTDFGFEGLFSVSPWPVGGGSLLELNLTALLAAAYLVSQIWRSRGTRAQSG